MSAIFSQPTVLLVVVLVLKATLILAIAGVATGLLGGSAAAVRHLVWTLAVGALLALPLLSLALPSLPVPVLDPVSTRATWSPLGSLAVEPTIAWPGAALSEAPVEPLSAGQLRTSAMDESFSLPLLPSHLPASLWLAGIWMLGALLVLGRLVAGRVSLYLLARRADIVPDPDWTRLVRDLSWMIDLNRPVHLLRSNRASMPMTWGTRRPIVLLPAEADEWPAERRRVVLIHELAHVKRCDCLTQMLAGLACALYWFHPGVWYAAGRLRAERERACDDRVLEVGTRASDYAGHLLEVARRFRSVGIASAAAVAMARPSQLEGRLLAVLDPVRSRWEPGRGARILAGIAALALVAPLAAMQAVSRVPDVEPAETPPAHSAVPVAAGAPEQIIERRFPAKPGQVLRFDLGTGGDIRVQGWDRNEVWVRAQLDGRDWRDTRVEFIEYPDGLEIGSRQVGEPHGYSTSHRFEVRVPQRFNVGVRSSGGGVELTELQGNFTGETGGGGLRLSKLRGAARLTTGGGGMMIADSHLEGEVRTGGGGVMVRNTTGGVQVHSGGGAVIRSGKTPDETRPGSSDVIRLHKAGGEITINEAPAGAELFTGGGSIVVRESGGPVRAQTGGGVIHVGSASGLVKLGSASGAITVEAVDGAAAATTGAGSVSIRMVGDARRGDRSVELRSGNGSIELTLPADIEATFDVEASYTSSFGHRPRIISDFPLDQSEAGRSVRATGRTESGKHRIYIRTENGDVRLRKGDGAVERVTVTAKARATPSIVYAVGSTSSERRRAVEMLGRNAPPAAALAGLTRLAWDDSDVEVQREAVEGLTELSGDAGMNELIRISRKHPHEEVRREAVAGLGALGCDESVKTLLKIVEHDGDAGVQRVAVKALGNAYRRSGEHGSKASSRISSLLIQIARTHHDAKVRGEAAEQVREIRSMTGA